MLLPWSRRRESEIGPRPNASSLSRQGTPDSARPDLIPSGKALKLKALKHEATVPPAATYGLPF